ncbi:hypothetical protein [Bradyrhizobium sp. 1(2017)]|uniref:hypothetical protein n=1 Tax=Bradyrhizobium sp. 1(2017) TaxID=1404888 RepID=UPI00140ED9B1|nr:hypothetical protein [Bradyrhizobium sp. 1(2017)]QIO32776.1 hypothetical protein HAP40_13685 [Bradyrhizobium sp. 1(2017)]
MQANRANHYPALVLVCLIIFIGVFAGRQFLDLWHGQVDTVGQTESVSLSLYGRFHGIALVTDAYSGEFPTFYNFLSDWLINLLAWTTGLPAYSAQVLIYVPFLIAFLFLGTYFSVRAVGGGRGAALLSAVLALASAETPFVHYLYTLVEPLSGLRSPTQTLIPPAQAIGIASSQGFGWGLFLPSLATLYRARRQGGVLLTLFAGALLGVCCLAHTLTFLQVATTASVYVVFDTIAARIREGRPIDALLRVAAILVLTTAIALVSRRTGVSMVNFAVYWFFSFIISLTDFRSLRFAAVYGLAALAVASPYLLQIWQLGLQGSAFQSYDSPLPKTEFVLFYLAYILCALLVFLNAPLLKRSDALIWIAAMLIVSIGMGYGKIFGFQNHEYRFLTNAILPFAVVSGFILMIPPSGSRRIAIFAVMPLLMLGVLRNLWATAGTLPDLVGKSVGAFTYIGRAIPLPEGASALLDSLRTQTAELTKGSRLLVPPEYEYPQQAYRNGLLLAVSRSPSFIPDPRYIMWSDLYADRVAVFCSLFPAYQHIDAHTSLRLCDKTPKEIAPDLILANPGLDVLSLYKINLLASFRGSQDSYLAECARTLGMTPIHDADGGMLWQSLAKPDPDRLHFGAASYTAPFLTIPFVAPQSGKYLVVLAGRSITKRVQRIQLGSVLVDPRPMGDSALAVTTDFQAGASQITLALTPDPRFRFVFPTPIRQIIGVRREVAAKFLVGQRLEELMR